MPQSDPNRLKLENEKQKLESRKLELEIAILGRPWFQQHQTWLGITGVVVAFISACVGFAGWFVQAQYSTANYTLASIESKRALLAKETAERDVEILNKKLQNTQEQLASRQNELNAAERDLIKYDSIVNKLETKPVVASPPKTPITVSGTVVGTDGQPIPGVSVSVSRDFRLLANNLTIADGSFSFDVESGSPLTIRFSCTGFVPTILSDIPGTRAFRVNQVITLKDRRPTPPRGFHYDD